ncbi:hypothetical protein B0H19DRAFT_1171841 [Mycena capillaripes]|nr:hypothetical protein B0H19DRAFT_1171841 [Mycena capillaripes]
MTAFLRRLSLRKARTSSVTSRSEQTPEKNLPEEICSPISMSNGPQTPKNALKFALKTLSTVSKHIPLGSTLSSIIDPLLYIAERIDQTFVNAHGLVELAARIETLAPIVSEMVERDPNRGQTVVEALRRELQSITTDLEAARSQGKLNQFFNSADNASSLSKHNRALAQMIADSTLVSVHEVLKTLHKREVSLDVKIDSYSQVVVPALKISGIGLPDRSGRNYRRIWWSRW